MSGRPVEKRTPVHRVRPIAFVVLLAVMATTGASADNTHITKFQIDGRLKDWAGVAPVWQDAGRAKVIFPQVFDVKEVYLDNDGRYLYVSLRLKPNLPDWFADRTETGTIGRLYIDTDSNADTGSKEITSILPMFHPAVDNLGDVRPESFRGFDCELAINVGLSITGRNPNVKPVSYVSYQLRELDDGGRFEGEVPIAEAASNKDPELIAAGAEGLELALPLQRLAVDAGDELRLMFVEDLGFGRAESCNWATYRLKVTPKK